MSFGAISPDGCHRHLEERIEASLDAVIEAGSYELDGEAIRAESSRSGNARSCTGMTAPGPPLNWSK